MKNRHLFLELPSLLVFGLSIALASDLAGGQTFNPLGLTNSYALDVSNDGTVIGFTGNNVLSRQLFRWTPNETILLDASVPSAAAIVETDGAAISADGSTIVGTYRTSGDGFQAFRWTSPGGYQLLGDFPGGGRPDSHGFDVNEDGTVVVGAGQFSDRTAAFRWTPATGLQDLGDGVAHAISPNAQYIVGQTIHAGTGAVRWTSDGQRNGLPMLPGSRSSSARAVANNGISAGFNTFGAMMSARSQAVRWTDEGVMSLGTFPGALPIHSTSALGISVDGTAIVGTAEVPAGDGEVPTRAFYWSETTGMVDLRDLLIGLGATGLDDWVLTRANAVSDDGLTIVGDALQGMRGEAFIATIPEPSTIVLAIIAAVAMSFALHRLRLR
ncbi:MAG: hypothetical protein WD894_11400 [Pirellulales bacterium]